MAQGWIAGKRDNVWDQRPHLFNGLHGRCLQPQQLLADWGPPLPFTPGPLTPPCKERSHAALDEVIVTAVAAMGL